MAKAPTHYLASLLEPWAAVDIKRMFGGLGAWRDGIFFALIIDDIMYFKVDATTRSDYAALHSEPFSYAVVKDGVKNLKVIDGLWRVPDEILEESDTLTAWAQTAWDIARLKPGKVKAKARTKAGETRESSHEFKGLGRNSLPLLRSLGITSRQQLDAIGAIDAYRQLKARYPKEVSLNMLWALYAVVNRLELTDVTPDIKDHVKSLLDSA